jgi:glutamate dehydrogenase/leucine dehydrogenase
MSGSGTFDLLDETGGRKLVFCRDRQSGLRALIAVHNTVGGQAGGGVRMRPYPSERSAARDALRLAQAMSLKYAAQGMPLGGAKAVIVGDPARDKSDDLLRAFGRFVEQFGGEYNAGEDVGTTGQDMAVIGQETQWLLVMPGDASGPGAGATNTATGVLNAIRGCCQHVWGEPSVAGRTVAVQGLGQVGMRLARILVRDGALVTVADVDARRVAEAAAELGVAHVPPDEICTLDVDVLAPCALGDAVNEDNVDLVQAAVVAGAANNAFSSTKVADRLQERGRVYAVDFVANAGATIYDDQMARRPRPPRLDEQLANAYLDGIFGRILEVFDIAAAEGVALWQAARFMAERNLSAFSHELDPTAQPPGKPATR